MKPYKLFPIFFIFLLMASTSLALVENVTIKSPDELILDRDTHEREDVYHTLHFDLDSNRTIINCTTISKGGLTYSEEINLSDPNEYYQDDINSNLLTGIKVVFVEEQNVTLKCSDADDHTITDTRQDTHLIDIHYFFEYSSDDLADSTVSAIAKTVIVFGSFIVIVMLVLLYTVAREQMKK